MAATNSQYLGWSGAAAGTSNLGLAPTAADALAIASASQTFTSGIYQANPEDTVDTMNNHINMALRTTTSTSLTEQSLIWDWAFVSYRYVGL